MPSDYRMLLTADDGNNYPGPGGSVSVGLPDFNQPGTQHVVWIRFVSDGGTSHADGNLASAFGAGLVVDNLQIKNSSNTVVVNEQFENPIPNLTTSLVNAAPAKSFGEWASLYQHITDNDACDENVTCSWWWTDPTLVAFNANMAFGPAGCVVRNWLDDIIVSPWISLGSTPSARNNFDNGRIAQNWSVRAQVKEENTVTSTIGDSIDCITPWGHASQWNSLSLFQWLTSAEDMTPYFDQRASSIQVRFRVGDWQRLGGAPPPSLLNPGPGPYLDDIRIIREVQAGPNISEGIDSRSQAQDAFATVEDLSITGGGHHYKPDPAGTNARFGSCAFSAGADLGTNGRSPKFITSDSIYVKITDTGRGGISSVDFYGAIVKGPHAGYAPVGSSMPPWFKVPVTPVVNASGVTVADWWFVDLDDDYFRGGDKLVYFWLASDLSGGYTSDPPGLTGVPSSILSAEAATGGLLEVSYLPTINWAPSYLNKVAQAAPSGKATPNAADIAASSQPNKILYIQKANASRRNTQGTVFMWSLDNLGYQGQYDVYDLQGFGNTNNDIGGRATVAQAKNYGVIIQDTGRGRSATIPSGTDLDSEKINQAAWYSSYLDTGVGAGQTVLGAGLWIMGENVVEANPTSALLARCGVGLVAGNQGISVSPDVKGVVPAFSFEPSGQTRNFSSDPLFSLVGGCPSSDDFDGLSAVSGGVETHRFVKGVSNGPGAVIMNANSGGRYTTVVSSFAWESVTFTLPFKGGPAPHLPDPAAAAGTFIKKVLSGFLGPAGEPGVPVDVSDRLPRATQLLQNVPNPFNPSTTYSTWRRMDRWSSASST